MKHKLFLLTTLTLQAMTGTLCNSGDHDHSAHDHGGHHHHHHHGGAAPDLEDLIKNFGIAVLGKDQESANDVSPTADHSHVNIKALIDELFHPSTTTSTTTTPLPTTSTQALPIKSHELGWDLAPVDLVMANSVLEPVFSADQRQTHSQLLAPAYLTETPYLARDDPSLGAGAREQLPRSAKSLDLDLELEPGLLSDKPTLPVLDTRRANFLLVNGRKRSKTGRRQSKLRRQKSELVSPPRAQHLHSGGGGGDQVLWRETVADHHNFDKHHHKEEKTPPSQQHLEHSSETKKCSHEADDILWRETVSQQQFITTSPHSFLPDTESSTATPLSDISPFLLPPTIQAVSSPPRTRNKEDRRKKGRNFRARFQDSGGGGVERAQGNVRELHKTSGGDRADNSGPGSRPGRRGQGRRPSRRGKKSDENLASSHRLLEPLSEHQLEEALFSNNNNKLEEATFNNNNNNNNQQLEEATHTRPLKKSPGKLGSKPRRGKSSTRSKLLNSVHTAQDSHIHHHTMMAAQRSSGQAGDKCRHSKEGLHADTESGCQRFYMCHEHGRSGRFSCPAGTLFSDKLGVCDWARRVRCV